MAARSQGAQMPNEALYLAAAAEFIHNATLLHDDVIDMSEKGAGAIPPIRYGEMRRLFW